MRDPRTPSARGGSGLGCGAHGRRASGRGRGGVVGAARGTEAGARGRHRGARPAAARAHRGAGVAVASFSRSRPRPRTTRTDRSELRKKKIEAMDRHRSIKPHAGGSKNTRSRRCAPVPRRPTRTARRKRRERVIADLAHKASGDRTARESVRDRLHELRHGWQEKQAAAHARELAVHDPHQPPRRGRNAHPASDYAVELSELASARSETAILSEEQEETGGLPPRSPGTFPNTKRSTT